MVHFRKAVLVLVVILLTGGCASADGANESLPRMSKEDAERWAKQWTESLARTAKAEIAPKTHTAGFTNCIGRNNETVNDGRFTLTYFAHAKLPKSQHASAVRAVREALEEKGFEIVGYATDVEVRGGTAVDAQHPKDRHFISVGDVADDVLTLSVTTPCLLPPGVEQQQL